MTGRELDRWRAYHRVEPLPGPHWMAAQICAAIVNSNRAKGPPAKLEDFLPRLERRGKRRRMTTEEMEAVFRAAADGINRKNRSAGKTGVAPRGEGTLDVPPAIESPP